MSSLYDTLINEFEKFFHRFEKTESPLLLEKRKAAFALFSEKNFPTTKQEDWRFTDVSAFLKDDFKLTANETVDRTTIQKMIAQAKIKGLDAYCLVLVNGVIYSEFSSLIQS